MHFSAFWVLLVLQQVFFSRLQFTASDGRQVTSTPAVVLIVNVSRRPGDTSCDTAWRPPGHGTLCQTSSQQYQPSHHSALRWRLVCSQELFLQHKTRDHHTNDDVYYDDVLPVHVIHKLWCLKEHDSVKLARPMAALQQTGWSIARSWSKQL